MSCSTLSLVHTVRWSVVTVLVLLLGSLVQPVFGFDLVILHTNDVHDRIEETNKFSGSCSEADSTAGECFGGMARLRTKIEEIRQASPNALLLDAGDQFQGTLWFFHFGGSLQAQFMNLLGYDAMCLGNHEFDNGVVGLLPLLTNVSFPVLSSNIDLSDTPAMQGLVLKSTTVTRGGQTIGIIGYTTKTTPYISNPGTVKFSDELAAIQAEADALTARGINKIIALGHAGYAGDVAMAKVLKGVDVIIGGHTNTFLYNGDPPSSEDPVGGYPTEVVSDLGETVLVVQDYAYGKYLGHLKVTFDDDGKVTGHSGNPILLDSSVAKDPDTYNLVVSMRPEVMQLQEQVVGQTHVYLEGDRRVCRVRECNLGNLITDAMLRQNMRRSDSVYWSDVSIAVQNSGGIRSSIPQGDISIGDAIKTQPFRNTIDIVELLGSSILTILEHGASLWTTGSDLYGGFLQVSGMRIVYDMTRPKGSRVLDVQVVCAKCRIPQFQPLNATEVYQVLMNTFLAHGGDQYSMIPELTLRRHILGNVDLDILVEHIKATTPLITGLEGRIRFYQEVKDDLMLQALVDETCSARTDSCKGDSAFGLVPKWGAVMLAFCTVAMAVAMNTSGQQL